MFNLKNWVSEYSLLTNEQLHPFKRTGKGTSTNVFTTTSCVDSDHILKYIHHICMNTPYRPGIVIRGSTESNLELKLLSLQVGVDLCSYTTRELIEMFKSQEGLKLYQDMLYDEEYQPRWVTIQDDSDDLTTIESTLVEMCDKWRIDVLIIDSLSDLIGKESSESYKQHMTLQKSLLKRGISIFNLENYSDYVSVNGLNPSFQ